MPQAAAASSEPSDPPQALRILKRERFLGAPASGPAGADGEELGRAAERLNPAFSAEICGRRGTPPGFAGFMGVRSASVSIGHPLDMSVLGLKFALTFLTNFCNHLQIVAGLLIGSWSVLRDQLEIGGAIAFISAITRLKDPWDELVDCSRNATLAQAKFRLIADAANDFASGNALAQRRWKNWGLPHS